VTLEEIDILQQGTGQSGSDNRIQGTNKGFDKDTQFNTIIDTSTGQIWFYRDVNGIVGIKVPIDGNVRLETENEGRKNLISVGDGSSVVIIIRQGG
jgi:hypothetical protein